MIKLVAQPDLAVAHSGNIGSIVNLAQELIRVPSQTGIDSPLLIITALRDWLAEQAIPAQILRDGDENPAAVLVEIGSNAEPTYCLNACLDTAPIGDSTSWSLDPTAGTIDAGWLSGRGSADSKTAASIFAHLGLEMMQASSNLQGTLALLFDADEHSGRFGGIKAYLRHRPSLKGLMLGYPGNERIVVGARGFWRATISVFGTSAHSGRKRPDSDNAIVKTATIVQRLNGLALPEEPDPYFQFGPKVTVTQIQGGQGYSVIPDRCTLHVDVRLTPRFDAQTAELYIRELCEDIDSDFPSRQPTVVDVKESWPPYRLPEDSKIVRALRTSARRILGRELPLVVAGSSNIGNYLASLGIDATCGFGVTYKNLHAPDECIELSSIAPLYEAYREAVGILLEIHDN